jgi:hypothetical protein
MRKGITMNVEAQKLELIDWILNLKDSTALKKITKMKNSVSKPKTAARKFGCGKDIFTYVSDDFDDPLPDFKDYMK